MRAEDFLLCSLHASAIKESVMLRLTNCAGKYEGGEVAGCLVVPARAASWSGALTGGRELPSGVPLAVLIRGLA